MLEKRQKLLSTAHVSLCVHVKHLLSCIAEGALAVMPTAFLAVTDSVHPELGGSLFMYQQVLLSQFVFKST